MGLRRLHQGRLADRPRAAGAVRSAVGHVRPGRRGLVPAAGAPARTEREPRAAPRRLILITATPRGSPRGVAAVTAAAEPAGTAPCGGTPPAARRSGERSPRDRG